MGSLLVVISQEPTQARAERLGRMAARSPHRGSLEVMHLPGASVGVQARQDECTLYADDALVVACQGRVYDPEVNDTEPYRVPSAERVARRWRAMGSRCLSELDGDFGVWVYDRRRDLAEVALSLSMARPLYVTARRDLVVIASEVRQVAAGAGIEQRLDLERAVELLVIGVPVLAPERTEYVDIDRLIAPNRYRCRLRPPSLSAGGTYWTPPQEQRFNRADAAALPRELLDLLAVAVDALPRNAGFSLSSGYDSGTLWAIAHRAGSVRADFRAYTLFHRGSPGDERETVRRLLTQTGTAAEFIDATDVCASDYIEAHIRQVDRVPQVGTLHTVDLIGAAARRDGVTCHVVGLGVEAWLYATAVYAAELLRRGRLARLLGDALRFHGYGSKPQGRVAEALRFIRVAVAPPGSSLQRWRRRARGAPDWLGPRWHGLWAAASDKLGELQRFDGFSRGQK